MVWVLAKLPDSYTEWTVLIFLYCFFNPYGQHQINNLAIRVVEKAAEDLEKQWEGSDGKKYFDLVYEEVVSSKGLDGYEI